MVIYLCACVCVCVYYWLFYRQHEHMGEKRNLALCAQTVHVVHTKENTEKLTEAVTRTRVDLNYVSFL